MVWWNARPETTTRTVHSTTCSIAPSTSPVTPPSARPATTATGAVTSAAANTSGPDHQPTASTVIPTPAATPASAGPRLNVRTKSAPSPLSGGGDVTVIDATAAARPRVCAATSPLNATAGPNVATQTTRRTIEPHKAATP